MIVAARVRLAAFAALVLSLVHTAPAAAQLSVSGGGLVGQPRTTILFQGTRERLGGVWFGGAVNVEVGPVAISAVGLRGALEAIENTVAPDRDEAGELLGRVAVSPLPWFAIEGGYAVRAFNSAAGHQEWKIPSIGATISGALGHPSLRAYLRATYLPAVKITGTDAPDLGVSVETGITAAFRSVPVFLSAVYRLERFDFPGGAASRLEQFEMLVLSVGFHASVKGVRE